MSKSNARIKNEDITLIARIAWEKLSIADMTRIFGKQKAKEWLSGETDFIKLWYYATAIEQGDLLETMNWYIDNQPIHVSRNEQL